MSRVTCADCQFECADQAFSTGGPDRKRTNGIVVLKAQGFTVGEIAATLSMTHDAVKERLRRARKGGAAEK